MGNCLGGAAAYPGNKRVAKPAYQPAPEDYKQVSPSTAVADAHFVTCPGGNALKLVGKPNRAETPNGQDGQAQYISVTLPYGVNPGDIIHVKAPDGRMNAITVPAGMGAGSTFTVEFSADTPAPPNKEDLTPGVYVPTVTAEPEPEYVMAVPAGAASAQPYSGIGTASAQPQPYMPAAYVK